MKLTTRWGPEGPPACQTLVLPESPTQWPPEGPRRVSAKRSRKIVCRTTFVDPFRTTPLQANMRLSTSTCKGLQDDTNIFNREIQETSAALRLSKRHVRLTYRTALSMSV